MLIYKKIIKKSKLGKGEKKIMMPIIHESGILITISIFFYRDKIRVYAEAIFDIIEIKSPLNIYRNQI